VLYDPDRLVRPVPRDPEAFKPVDLPGGDLPAMVKWAIEDRDVEAAFDIRRQVFVEEQGYTEEQEFDEAEPLALHVLAKFARRMGLGMAIVEFILEGAKDMGCVKARAGAQRTALDFWARLGFRPTGEEYMDFHVPHEWTERQL